MCVERSVAPHSVNGSSPTLTAHVDFVGVTCRGIDCVITDYIHFNDNVLTAIKGVNWVFGLGGVR